MSDDLSNKISRVKSKVKERIKGGSESASRRMRENYHGVRQQAQETASEMREERKEAQRPRSGVRNLQQTTEMADPVGTTLDPATAPENVQYLVTGPPGTHNRGDELVTGGGGGMTEAEAMVTGSFAGENPGTEDNLARIDTGFDFGGGNGEPDDDLVLPGEGGFEW